MPLISTPASMEGNRCSNMMPFRCKGLSISRCTWITTNGVGWRHMENVAQKGNSWLKSYFICIFHCFHLHSAVQFDLQIASISCNGFYLRIFVYNCNQWQQFCLESIVRSILCSDVLIQNFFVYDENCVKECSFWMWLCFLCEYLQNKLPLNNIDEIYNTVMLKATLIKI
jgi:hypothetical protein